MASSTNAKTNAKSNAKTSTKQQPVNQSLSRTQARLHGAARPARPARPARLRAYEGKTSTPRTPVQTGQAGKSGKAGKTRWDRMRKDDISLAQLTELLVNEKRASGKSGQTVTWYTGALRRYGEWLVEQRLEPTLSNFTLERVRAYIVALQRAEARARHPLQPTEERPLSDASINSYVRALRGFSNWLFEEGYTDGPALARLKAPKVTQKTQPILTAEEIAEVVCSLNPRTETGARDQAMFLLLLDTGMRAGELCGLRLQHLHLDDGYAIVLGKGRKERPVKIGARAAKAVRFYMLHWRRPAQPHEDHVFLTCRGVVNAGAAFSSAGGEPLTVCALDQIFTRIGRQAGVERLHPHLLRHTFACMHLLRYRDPFALKSLLGHTTLQMTNHYCEAVRQMEVVRADTTSIVDGIDTKALEVNRRGRLARNGKRTAL